MGARRAAPEPDGEVVALESVSKRYGAFTAVEDLSFDVRRGEILGFLGPNGAGKTTTLRMILDIVPPTSGAVRVLGGPPDARARRRIGYLPEERGLYRKMRAAQTIAYFAKLNGTPAGTARRRAHELLDRFGLGGSAKSKIEALSKGMAQKVQILTAIAHDPDLLIFDEPFSGLDPVNQQTLEDLVLELRAAGKTIIFSTHVMSHAERLCDRFLMLARGRRRFLGDLAEARALMPRRLLIETPDDVAPIAAIPEVTAVTPVEAAPGGDPVYEVALVEGADAQIVLKTAFETGVRLKRFDQSEPALHDIFVQVVGEAEAGDVE